MARPTLFITEVCGGHIRHTNKLVYILFYASSVLICRIATDLAAEARDHSITPSYLYHCCRGNHTTSGRGAM